MMGAVAQHLIGKYWVFFRHVFREIWALKKQHMETLRIVRPGRPNLGWAPYMYFAHMMPPRSRNQKKLLFHMNSYYSLSKDNGTPLKATQRRKTGLSLMECGRRPRPPALFIALEYIVLPIFFIRSPLMGFNPNKG